MRLGAVRKSVDSPGYGPFEGDEENAPESESSPLQRRLTPFRVGGRVKSRRGRNSILARLARQLAAQPDLSMTTTTKLLTRLFLTSPKASSLSSISHPVSGRIPFTYD